METGMNNLVPSHITVSELEAYARCPMEYYLKYHRGVPAQRFESSFPTELPGNILGDLVHTVVRTLLESSSETCAAVVDRLTIQNQIPPQIVQLPEIETLCARALTFHQKRKWGNYRVETPFVLKVGDSLVRGTIDFLGQDAQGWHIVDYKTDKLATAADMPKRAASYQLQMAAYAAAAHCAGLTPLLDTTLLFLRIDDAVTQAITTDTAQTAIATLSEIIAQITTQRWDIGPTPPCRTCPYHHNGMCWEDQLK